MDWIYCFFRALFGSVFFGSVFFGPRLLFFTMLALTDDLKIKCLKKYTQSIVWVVAPPLYHGLFSVIPLDCCNCLFAFLCNQMILYLHESADCLSLQMRSFYSVK